MAASAVAGVFVVAVAMASAAKGPAPSKGANDADIARYSQTMLEEGRKTFRYDTFGSEAFWGDALQLHKAIAGEKNGGVGAGVSPKTALAVGLKVDADALPGRAEEADQGGQGQPRRPGHHDRAAQAERGRRRHGVRDPERRREVDGASSARSAIRPSTIRSRPASASGWTAGRTATSTSARSSRSRPT